MGVRISGTQCQESGRPIIISAIPSWPITPAVLKNKHAFNSATNDILVTTKYSTKHPTAAVVAGSPRRLTPGLKFETAYKTTRTLGSFAYRDRSIGIKRTSRVFIGHVS